MALGHRGSWAVQPELHRQKKVATTSTGQAMTRSSVALSPASPMTIEYLPANATTNSRQTMRT
jgi:hypothetical protein